MADINQLILQSFDVISLILVFAFVLFDVRYPKIVEILNRPRPDASLKNEYRAYKVAVATSLLSDALPLIVLYGAMLVLFTPLVSRVLSTYRFSLGASDFVQTAFLLIILLISCFFTWALVLGILHVVRLLKKADAGNS